MASFKVLTTDVSQCGVHDNRDQAYLVPTISRRPRANSSAKPNIYNNGGRYKTVCQWETPAGCYTSTWMTDNHAENICRLKNKPLLVKKGESRMKKEP